jgi:hypothetical protein
MITVTLCCVIVFIVPINTLPNFVFLVTDDQDLTLRSVVSAQHCDLVHVT